VIAVTFWLAWDTLTGRGRRRALALAQVEADAAHAELRAALVALDKSYRNLAVMSATLLPGLGPPDDVAPLLLLLKRTLPSDDYAAAFVYLTALDARLEAAREAKP